MKMTTTDEDLIGEQVGDRSLIVGVALLAARLQRLRRLCRPNRHFSITL